VAPRHDGADIVLAMLNAETFTSPAAAAIALALLWIGEAASPMFHHGRERFRHRLRNLSLGLLNALVTGGGFAFVTYTVVQACAGAEFGLLRALDLHWALAWLIAFCAIDFSHYLFHLAAHHVPLLWRMHLVHHHDHDIDVTSAMRFHTVEIAIQCTLMLGVYALLGVSMGQVLLYEAVLLPVAMFHHANVAISEPLDRVLRLVIVTPRMHWVHHSRWQPETDSNFSAVLSIWDRLFGSYRWRRDPRTIDFGLDGYDDDRSRTLSGMLVAPFEPVRSEYGVAPATGASESVPPLLVQPFLAIGRAATRRRRRRRLVARRNARRPSLAGRVNANA
jgi:sterol desaturase/sphingolipid hydroxylase (fatty acid hydroxylase superfamily)